MEFITLHISGEDTDVAYSTTLNCSSSAVNTSARDCCVNRVNGLLLNTGKRMLSVHRLVIFVKLLRIKLLIRLHVCIL